MKKNAKICKCVIQYFLSLKEYKTHRAFQMAEYHNIMIMISKVICMNYKKAMKWLVIVVIKLFKEAVIIENEIIGLLDD